MIENSEMKWNALSISGSPVTVVATQPLLRDRGMVEDHGAPEAGQLTMSWTRGRRETRVAKE